MLVTKKFIVNGTILLPFLFILVVLTRRQKSMSTSGTSGTLYMVATPIGNLEDITLRALRILKEVSVVAAEDTRRTAKLLRHYDISTPTRSFHAHNERTQADTLLRRLSTGQSVAVVTDAGTPLISDPGARLVEKALNAGFSVQAIPGPSAVLAALVASGMATSQFTFVGFPPSRSYDRKTWFKSLMNEARPLVLFEAPHRIKRSLKDMFDVFGDRQIAICRELTKVHEELVKGRLSEVTTEVLPRGEFTLILFPDPLASPKKKTVPNNIALTQEFGELTKHCSSRREAVKELALYYGISSRDIYRRLEQAKNNSTYDQ